MRVASAKRGKTRAIKSRLVLALLLIGWESGVRYFSQSLRLAMQNQSKHKITFETQLKKKNRFNENKFTKDTQSLSLYYNRHLTFANSTYG